MSIKNYESEYFSFWEHLSDEQKEYLVNNSRKHTYQKGEMVHSGNTECLGILLVLKGSLRTYMVSEEGREIVLFRMVNKQACVLSASCILDMITFDVNIEAEEETEVIIIKPDSFQNLSNENPYVENFMYKVAIERFSEVMWVMEQILFMSMDKRLAIFLLDRGPVIKMTHEQIAKNMGTAREVVSRMLKYFEDEGYVSLSRGKVTVENRASLMKFI